MTGRIDETLMLVVSIVELIVSGTSASSREASRTRAGLAKRKKK